jgi:hypothetical protein
MQKKYFNSEPRCLDFNPKPKYSKVFLPKANILKNILTLRPSAQAKTCFSF